MTLESSDAMSAATAPRPSPRTPWSPSSAHMMASTNRSTRPARTPGSTGRRTPSAADKMLSPSKNAPPTSSPNYFEYISDPDLNPPNSNAGLYAKMNWHLPSGDGPKTSESSGFQPLETQQRYENFRRESEGKTFNLSLAGLGYSSAGAENQSPVSPEGRPGIMRSNTSRSQLSPRTADGREQTVSPIDAMELDPPSASSRVPSRSVEDESLVNLRRTDSPIHESQTDLTNLPRHHLSRLDERHPRHSLPHNRVDPLSAPIQRSETEPVPSLKTDGPTFITSQDFEGILRNLDSLKILLLDLRVSHQYARSRIAGAINICIPTTLLKRASYNVQRLSASFSKQTDRDTFDQWRETNVIAVYDTSASQMSDAVSCVNILKKFTQEDWHGATFIIRGGYNSFLKTYPNYIDHRPADELDGSSKGLCLDPPAAAPVAGGCQMPIDKNAANPFFGTIRQNMDLVGGVGQVPVQVPFKLKTTPQSKIPGWLRKASEVLNEGKLVSDSFLKIEKDEQSRMRTALTADVSYGTPNPLAPPKIQVAGIEKGMKNRYKDILPFDHTRVRLQSIPDGECDYVNASHVQARGSRKKYIASQAPVPSTFQDFWRVAWEQDIRVIVMLTAEVEGGNIKCHPYWIPGEYGSFKLKALSERKLSLDGGAKTPKDNRSFTAPLKISSGHVSRPSMSRRHSSKHSISTSKASPSSSSPAPQKDDVRSPHVVVRKICLSKKDRPFEPMREITQVQYSSWPDFGAPAEPAHVLALVNCCNDIAHSYQSSSSKEFDEISRPMVVHCSAGCGRTGTFCTIDSVIDILKQQRTHRRQYHSSDSMPSSNTPIRPSPKEDKEDNGVHDYDHDSMDVDPLDTSFSNNTELRQRGSASGDDLKGKDFDLLDSDEVDLIDQTVASFRLQRVSMVQTLRQFVLCYEAVLEWFAEDMNGG